MPHAVFAGRDFALRRCPDACRRSARTGTNPTNLRPHRRPMIRLRRSIRRRRRARSRHAGGVAFRSSWVAPTSFGIRPCVGAARCADRHVTTTIPNRQGIQCQPAMAHRRHAQTPRWLDPPPRYEILGARIAYIAQRCHLSRRHVPTISCRPPGAFSSSGMSSRPGGVARRWRFAPMTRSQSQCRRISSEGPNPEPVSGQRGLATPRGYRWLGCETMEHAALLLLGAEGLD